MNEPVTVIATGRVTQDLELKTSQNGKNTKYVQFGFAVNKGYGENSHPNFYSCVIFMKARKTKILQKPPKNIWFPHCRYPHRSNGRKRSLDASFLREGATASH